MPWPEQFPDKVTPDIDFKDELVVQCYAPVVKIFFVGAGNLQMMNDHK